MKTRATLILILFLLDCFADNNRDTRYKRFVKMEWPEMFVDNLVTRALVTNDGTLWVFLTASAREMYHNRHA